MRSTATRLLYLRVVSLRAHTYGPCVHTLVSQQEVLPDMLSILQDLAAEAAYRYAAVTRCPAS